MSKIYETSLKGNFPSVNIKYIVSKQGRMVLSPDYRRFKELIAGMAQAEYKGEPIETPFSVEISVKTYKDIDNFVKAILDGMEGIVYTNDRNCVALCVSKTAIKRGQEDEIEITVESK